MKNIQRLAISGLFLTAAFTAAYPQPSQDPPQPSRRLQQLAASLPEVGRMAEMKKLGLSLAFSDKLPSPARQDAPSYIFVMPRNLDRGCTDLPPLAGKYPGIHLNLPLQVQPSYINYLFISDQPERITDTRKRTPPAGTLKETGVAQDGLACAPGATGIYARSPIPAKSTVRILVDHTNGTKRPLHFSLVWVPQNEGFLSIRKRSQSVHKDSVAAGSRSFELAGATIAEPRLEERPDQAMVLTETALKPDETVVLHMEMFTSAPGQMAAVVSEEAGDRPKDVAALDALPVLHSVVWQEEEGRLGKFIDPRKDPKRYQRIKSTFQHARGHFQFPDRSTQIDYKVGSWKESDCPTQVYSLFESIPGVDVTVARGSKPATTDNRGKYGARVGLKLNLKQLPPGCREMALLAINRGDVFGGRHWVSDGRKTAFETILRPGLGEGVLRKMHACNLWRGPVKAGDTLTMWTEPMANTSVHLLYVLVPLPPAP